jgi:hypothetical protein
MIFDELRAAAYALRRVAHELRAAGAEAAREKSRAAFCFAWNVLQSRGL